MRRQVGPSTRSPASKPIWPIDLTAVVRSERFPVELTGYREFTVRDEREALVPMLPLGVVHLIFQLGTTWRHRGVEAGTWEPRPDVFVAGPFDRGYQLAATPGSRVLSIEFNPGRAPAFFDVPVCELRGRLIRPEELWGAAADVLVQRVTETSSSIERARIVDEFLATRYRPRRVFPMDAVLRRIRETRGRATVAQLSEAAGWSVAHLRRRFTETVGVSPKAYLRIERLRRVAAALRADPAVRLTQVAHRFGYFDQSHFIRDFRALTGATPSGFLLCDMSDFYKS